MLLLLLLSLTVVLFSALSSMSEAAFLSISEVDVEKAHKEYGENSAATELKSLQAGLTHTISVLVILNNIANIVNEPILVLNRIIIVVFIKVPIESRNVLIKKGNFKQLPVI